MKKSLQIVLFFALAFAASPAFAAEGDKVPQAKRADRPSFKDMDKNGDGNLSKDEVPERAWGFLSKRDTDKNGVVSMKELIAGGQSQGKGKGQSGAGGDFFARSDRNKDGKISKNEVPATFWERMSRLDKNGDGAISKSELPQQMRSGGMTGNRGKGGMDPSNPASVIKFYDKNKDGKIEKSEVPAESWARLSNADEDADGRVSSAELTKVFKDRSKAGMMKAQDAPKKKASEN